MRRAVWEPKSRTTTDSVAVLGAGGAVKQELLELVEGHASLLGRLLDRNTAFAVATSSGGHSGPACEAVARRATFGLRVIGHEISSSAKLEHTGNHGRKEIGSGLGSRDSNPGTVIQSHVSYR